MTIAAEQGIRVTYPDGTTEDVLCNRYFFGDQILHTDGVKAWLSGTHGGYTLVRGPSFPLASLRKFEHIR